MSGNDSNTVSLLHLDGANNSTTFTDSAFGGTHTWSAVAAGPVISTAQSKFGGSSLLLSGAAGCAISTPVSTDFNFGSGDFTIDFWWKPASASANYWIWGHCAGAGDTNGLQVDIPNGNPVYYWNFRDSGGTNHQFHGGSVTNTNWKHVALVRYGNTAYIYIDGSSVATLNCTGLSTWYPNQPFTIGREGSTDYNNFSGYIDEFQISKGIARWAANFTPPTAAYMVTGQLSPMPGFYPA